MEKEYLPILVGQEDKLKVFIEYGEYLKIIKFAKAGASDGSRGVLLGKKDNNNIYITRALEAIYCGTEGLESPAFSPESWGRIKAEIEENYKELEILGQFSSHTPFKIERTDYIMQDKFFSKESNILFLFDPANNSEKMFIYKDKEFTFLNGFYLFDKYEKPIDLTHREALVRPLSREYEIRMRLFDDIKKKIKRQNHLYAAVAVIFLLLILYNIIHSFELEKRIGNISFPDRETAEWKIELKN